MAKQHIPRHYSLSAVIWAGVAAGTVSTLAQVLLWLLFTDEFPAVLFRDARLTAALVMGSRVLPPPATFDTGVWFVAALVHFALSIFYAALLAPFAARLGNILLLAAGATFGIVLYAVNLYGFTGLFPWFAQARGWNAAVAHAVFGMTSVYAYRYLHLRNARSQPGEH